MSPEKFVKDIREQIIDRGILNYKKTFESTDKSPDETWQFILSLYHSLSLNEREDLLNFIRLVMVNSTSHFLGIVDGASYLNENRDEVNLTDKSSGEKLNNFLQDIFLELEEDN